MEKNWKLKNENLMARYRHEVSYWYENENGEKLGVERKDGEIITDAEEFDNGFAVVGVGCYERVDESVYEVAQRKYWSVINEEGKQVARSVFKPFKVAADTYMVRDGAVEFKNVRTGESKKLGDDLEAATSISLSLLNGFDLVHPDLNQDVKEEQLKQNKKDLEKLERKIQEKKASINAQLKLEKEDEFSL